MIRNVSLDKLGTLSPYAAFRVGMYEDSRRMWMHLAGVYKRYGRPNMMQSAVGNARDAHKQYMKELRAAKGAA